MENIKLLKTLFILLILSIITTGYSQSVKQDTFYRSAGVDATFINSFLPFESNIGSRDKYIFHYIKYGKNDRFIRQAFDIDIFGNFEKNDSDVDRNDARFDVSYKISRGKRLNVFKNGYILYGTEFHLDYFLNQRSVLDLNDPEEENFNTNLDQTVSIALGPFLGLEYKISKRLSLYTESGIYLNFAYSVDKFRSDFKPELDFQDSSISVQDIFNLPSSIILFYSF